MIIAYDKKEPQGKQKNLTNKLITKTKQQNPVNFSKRQMKLCKVPEEQLFNFISYQRVRWRYLYCDHT